jgi:hypothetical protein
VKRLEQLADRRVKNAVKLIGNVEAAVQALVDQDAAAVEGLRAELDRVRERLGDDDDGLGDELADVGAAGDAFEDVGAVAKETLGDANKALLRWYDAFKDVVGRLP